MNIITISLGLLSRNLMIFKSTWLIFGIPAKGHQELLRKLRTGNSLSTLSVMFQISNQSIISKGIAGSRIALMEHFVPKFLGFSHKTRDKFVSKHTRPFVQNLLANGIPVAVLRDSIDFLEKIGLKHEMLDYLSRGCKQYTTHSRCDKG